jgi:hypothetical protein
MWIISKYQENCDNRRTEFAHGLLIKFPAVPVHQSSGNCKINTTSNKHSSTTRRESELLLTMMSSSSSTDRSFPTEAHYSINSSDSEESAYSFKTTRTFDLLGKENALDRIIRIKNAGLAQLKKSYKLSETWLDNVGEFVIEIGFKWKKRPSSPRKKKKKKKKKASRKEIPDRELGANLLQPVPVPDPAGTMEEVLNDQTQLSYSDGDIYLIPVLSNSSSRQGASGSVREKVLEDSHQGVEQTLSIFLNLNMEDEDEDSSQLPEDPPEGPVDYWKCADITYGFTSNEDYTSNNNAQSAGIAPPAYSKAGTETDTRSPEVETADVYTSNDERSCTPESVYSSSPVNSLEGDDYRSPGDTHHGAPSSGIEPPGVYTTPDVSSQYSEEREGIDSPGMKGYSKSNISEGDDYGGSSKATHGNDSNYNKMEDRQIRLATIARLRPQFRPTSAYLVKE